MTNYQALREETSINLTTLVNRSIQTKFNGLICKSLFLCIFLLPGLTTAQMLVLRTLRSLLQDNVKEFII